MKAINLLKKALIISEADLIDSETEITDTEEFLCDMTLTEKQLNTLGRLEMREGQHTLELMSVLGKYDSYDFSNLYYAVKRNCEIIDRSLWAEVRSHKETEPHSCTGIRKGFMVVAIKDHDHDGGIDKFDGINVISLSGSQLLDMLKRFI